MSTRLAALVRTALLLALLGLSAFYDPVPRWWWLALVAVLLWTLLDFLLWEEPVDDDED